MSSNANATVNSNAPFTTPMEPSDKPLPTGTLTRTIYVQSQALEIQRMFAGEYNLSNRQKITALLMQFEPAIPIDQDTMVMNGDPDVIMARRAQYGYTSVPSVQEGNPFNAQQDPATGQFTLPPLCSIPGVTIPGVPTYEEYLDEHGPFAIPVSIDAADYPVNPGGVVYPVSCVGADYTAYFALKQLLSDLVGPHVTNGVAQPGDPAMTPYNDGNKILLVDQTDAMDTPMNGDSGVEMPQLVAYTSRPNDSQRFGLILKLDGKNLRAYWDKDVATAYHKMGIEGVKALAY